MPGPRTEVEVRALQRDDVDALRAFFAHVPEGDRTFFREDVLASGVVERWLADPDQHRLVAVVDSAIVGHVAVLRGVGWSRHVGEIRLVVDPEHRGRTIGRGLARQAVIDAVDLGLSKLIVEVISDQTGLIAMFRALGFDPEALLADHVRDRSGEVRDLMVLSNDVESQFSSMATAGITDQI